MSALKTGVFLVWKIVEYWSWIKSQGGFHQQEVYRASFEKGTRRTA
jgi:hypothetical protein